MGETVRLYAQPHAMPLQHEAIARFLYALAKLAVGRRAVGRLAKLLKDRAALGFGGLDHVESLTYARSSSK